MLLKYTKTPEKLKYKFRSKAVHLHLCRYHWILLTVPSKSVYRETIEYLTYSPGFTHDIMQATQILCMARGKGKTIPIKLLSSAGTGFFYTTRKNVSRNPDKLAFVKYDPVVRRRVLFQEAKIK